MKIPVIVVFTKYDLLINEQRIDALENNVDRSNAELERRADVCFHDRTKGFKELKPSSIVKVSTDRNYPRSFCLLPSRSKISLIPYAERLKSLQELTSVTRKCLGDYKEEGASVPWIIAQRISVAQKVELSVKCVL